MDVKNLIKSGEGETLEFKENFSEKVIETLVSFANHKGGKVILGINDNKKVILVELGKESVANWINEIKNKTEPQIFPILDFEIFNKKKYLF